MRYPVEIRLTHYRVLGSGLNSVLLESGDFLKRGKEFFSFLAADLERSLVWGSNDEYRFVPH